jgi:hypothetical protein
VVAADTRLQARRFLIVANFCGPLLLAQNLPDPSTTHSPVISATVAAAPPDVDEEEIVAESTQTRGVRKSRGVAELIVLDAKILIRAVLGKRVRPLPWIIWLGHVN